MGMDTNLHGRLRNTSLPLRHGLMPLFEAVVNSIHAIEEAGLSADRGEITVEICRTPQQYISFDDTRKPGREAYSDIIGFKITDNGVGFNDVNMMSFNTFDSEHKANRGCRGVGRLLWLKAFKNVKIKSVYKDEDGNAKAREFTFTATGGVSEPTTQLASSDAKVITCIHLDNFEKRYREASKKTIGTIANNLFEHCLWYFVRTGGAPKICVRDEDEIIHLDKVYDEHMLSSACTENVTIKGRSFDLTHIKLRANSSQSHVIAFCAANRPVKEESITGKLPGLYGKVSDINGEFIYACYVCSDFLDERVRSERTSFDLDEDVEGLFAESEISFRNIRDIVHEKIAAYLAEYLENNKKIGRERLENFVSIKAPRYRPILSRIPEEQLCVDPNISDKELDLALHKHLYQIESKLLADGHAILAPAHEEGLAEYKKRLEEYIRTAEDIKKSDLANYVSHRKVILELLECAIQRDEYGKYAREDFIHTLIMPMRTDSNEMLPDSCNLWLIDERLAFHHYLASDKTLNSMPITGATETKRPDICTLNVYDNPILVSEGDKLPLASIVVVEIKKPMRDDAAAGEDYNAVEQALGYLERIRDGGVTTAKGRPIPNSSDIPGFCYAICDLTKSVIDRCRLLGLTVTADHMGYFGYNPNFKAYIEVLSFDRLVNAAKERNRAFFGACKIDCVNG